MKRFWNTKEGRRILYGAAIIVTVIAARVIFLQEEATVPVEQAQKTVEVARVYDIASGTLPLPTVGRVESQSEATLRAEASGAIGRVTKKIGDRVRAGEIIAEIDNASERAEVLRAEGVLQGAQANEMKIQNGSNESRTLIKEAVRNAFTTADDAVRNKADQMITDPESVRPEITTAASDYFIRQRAGAARAELNTTFDEWTVSLQSLNGITNTEALVVYVLTAQRNLEEVRSFLDDMALIVSGFEPNSSLTQGTIDKWRSDISMARSSVNGSLSGLISSYNGLRSQVDASNGGGEDLLLVQAQVKQAEAGVLSAQASLEKTIIRSPIAGEVNQIEIKQGDFVSMQQEVAVIANNNALEITSSINEEDRKTIAVGASVLIDGTYKGVVTRIAPAVNRETGKIEIAIGVDENTSLSNGQSVSLAIDRTVTSNAAADGVITIPITALKITAEGNFVFSVENGVLISHAVTVGSIIGEKIMITDGLSPTMEIVLDARGLKEGQSVTIR
jgi:multidrug efflux pump subunit AcrA (membrane-fusion protein)